MTQVSTPEFDLIFRFKERTEARIDKLSDRLKKAEDKVEDLSDDPITNAQQRQLGRYEALVDTRSARLTELQADLAELNAIPLPEDKFDISFARIDDGLLSLRFSITDSPYDDLYEGGDTLKFRYISENKGSIKRSTISTAQFVEDGTTSFRLGSSRWLKMAEDNEGTFQILNSDNDVLFSTPFTLNL